MKKVFLRTCTILIVCCLCIGSIIFPLSVFAEDESQVSAPLDNTTFSAAEGSYQAYFNKYSKIPTATKEIKYEVEYISSAGPLSFSVLVPSDGLYTFGMSYRATGIETGMLAVDLKIDGTTPFNEAGNLSFPRMWKDEEENRKDGNGNEFAAKQVAYDDFYYNIATDINNQNATPYEFYLTAGTHNITINSVFGSFDLNYLKFDTPETIEPYKAPTSKDKYYNGDSIIIEGEKAILKSNNCLISKTDNSSPTVTPNSTFKSLVNYIGGGNWNTIGDTIIWETPELEEGYYNLGFSFRQSSVLGGSTYRSLKIDGKTPFAEASEIGFTYSYQWQQSLFADKNNNPYLIYLSKGKHEIALSVVIGEIKQVCEILDEAVAMIGSLYIDITMITGESADSLRDYNLFKQIPDMQDRLNKIYDLLDDANKLLVKVTGQKSGSHASVIGGMMQVVDQMINNKYSAHRYQQMYYDKYCALAADLTDLRKMPLDIDKIVLTAPNTEEAFESVNVIERITFSFESFLASFVQDYNNISKTADASKEIKVWVNWGRDQAQVLNSMAKGSFTEKTGIPVNIQLVNASIVQALLSGESPDCILQQARSEPVNLAMRGVLYDLNKFSDVENILDRFQEDAELPYRYNGGLYALPDTQQFYLMYYRKDILEKLEISIPDTWDDFRQACKLLKRNNLNVWIPNSIANSAAQTAAGVGSINLFPTLLLQKGLALYKEDGRSTNLSDPSVIVTFTEWTDYYTMLKLPKTFDFYNRFRMGTAPIGIATNTMYTTLQATAPEIEGSWGVTHIPGTLQSDGTVSHVSAGSGTACAILSNSKNPESAWEFLKWWTQEDTQLSYSNEVESILGPTGRVSVSNVNAFSKMSWDTAALKSMLSAWDEVIEIPEYPGSYYVSRSIYQSFWNVVDDNRNAKDMLLKYSKEADAEISRKWNQYEDTLKE